MADSDNTTTLPPITRRKTLAGTATATMGWEPTAFSGNNMKEEQSVGPAVAAWRAWQAAHEETDRFCRQQQNLERKLIDMVGFPCVTIQLSDGERVTVHSPRTLRELLDPNPELAAAHITAEADLAAHQARWDVADKEISHSATLRTESEARERTEDLLKALVETPAASLVEVTAKLDAVPNAGQPGEYYDEFPWPQIRSVFEYVGRIGQSSRGRLRISGRF